MIYLFNSAIRPLYTRNVLNTLFIPKGGTNEYRYRFRGSPKHIAPESQSVFLNAPLYEPVVITFIDRFGISGYTYHPLRMGKLVTCREEQDRLFFRVSLEEFIYPRDIVNFNQTITRSLRPFGLPCLTGNDPLKSDDGYYAINAGTLFTAVNDFHHGDEAWENAVENLRTTKAFSEVSPSPAFGQEDSDTPREFLFVKCDIRSTSTQRQNVAPKIRDDWAVFDLLRGKRYEFVLLYRYPSQRINTSYTGIVEAKFGENLRALGSTSINIDSYSNCVPLPFATKRHLEDNTDGVSFEFKSSRPDFQLIGSDARLLFRFRESKRFWVSLIILLLLFTTLSVIIGADFTDIIPLTVRNIWTSLRFKVLAGIIQAMVLFFLFRLMGKKFL